MEGVSTQEGFHVGESIREKLEVLSKEKGFSSYQYVYLVPVYVQADGHELQAIFNQITGIPHAHSAVRTWRGDLAAFIADNLNLQDFEYRQRG